MIELMEESIGEKQQNIEQSLQFSRTVMATKKYCYSLCFWTKEIL